MSFGKMNQIISIVKTDPNPDTAGFADPVDTVLANVRAYREDRHGTQIWVNRAAFSTATAMFRFRIIPGLTVTPRLFILCGGERFRILSAEDVRGRGMYWECLAETVSSSQN